MKIKKIVKSCFASVVGRPATQRRFIDHSLGVSGFLKQLKDNNINYVVLRWFEDLPRMSPGEDIDILVADEDVEELTSYVSANKKTEDIPCDIYSVSGLPGTSSRGMPYYPVNNAMNILDNAVWLNGIVRVPAKDEHFLSLCYHALYHKGYSSGIPSRDPELNSKVVTPEDHDYRGAIERLYRESSFSIDNFEVTLEGIDRVLEEKGWRPANDTLDKISQRNEWVRDVLSLTVMSVPDYLKGLSVFLVREKGKECLSFIKERLFVVGFDHVMEGRIPDDQMQTISASIRGGNWGKGPWPKSGGLPIYYFVVVDSKVIDPRKKILQEHGGLDNERIPLAKQEIRNIYNQGRPPSDQCNIVHSTDNAVQALEYLSLLNPEAIEHVIDESKRKYALFNTPFRVVKDLSKRARRAKVELIDYHGKKAICKTFKEGRERYLQREIVARDIGKGMSEISSILEVGENYIVLEYCGEAIDKITGMRPLLHDNGYLPLWAIKRMKDIIVHYRSHGYECVDFNPRNVLFDTEKGLKVIDFEFLQKTANSSGALEGNYAWYSASAGFEGDLPQVKDGGSLYNKRWFKYTGLPLFFCAHDFPAPVLHAVRGMTYFYFSIKNAGRKFFSLSVKKFSLR